MRGPLEKFPRIYAGGRIISGGDGEKSRNVDLKKDLVGVKTRE